MSLHAQGSLTKRSEPGQAVGRRSLSLGRSRQTKPEPGAAAVGRRKPEPGLQVTEAVDQSGSRFSFPGHVSVKGGGSNVVALHWRFVRQLGVTVGVV